MTEVSVSDLSTEHSEHCSCRLLAQTISLDPHLVSFEYCHRVLQRRWQMQCRHGHHMDESLAEVNVGTGASQDARHYGMTLVAASQSAKLLKMVVSSATVTALMNDASDGMMDGKKGIAPVSMTMGGMMGTSAMASNSGTSALASAMTGFVNSAGNMSGVTATDMSGLTQKLNTSNGRF